MKTILGSEKKDWNYLILSTFSGFILLGIYFVLLDVLKLSTFPTYVILIVIYSVLFDVNHYFSTYFRVFLDKSYFKENRKWILIGLLFVTVVPLIIYWWTTDGSFTRRGYFFFVFFRRFVLTLGFYHLVKQNWGFMAMYKSKANEVKTKINWDKLTLISGSFVPFTLLNIIGDKGYMWFPSSEKYIFDAAYITPDVIIWWNDIATTCFILFLILGGIALCAKKFQFSLPARNVSIFCLFVGLLIKLFMKWDVSLILTSIFCIIAGVFIVSLIQSIRFQIKQKSINKQKWAVLISTLILYFGIILFPVQGDKFIIVAAITLPHNIQYLAFVPIFSRKQYKQDKKDHGLAKKLSTHVVSLFVLGMFFSIIFEFGRTGTQFILSTNFNGLKIFFSIFFIVLILHHYYLDAVIWKFSKDKEINKVQESQSINKR